MTGRVLASLAAVAAVLAACAPVEGYPADPDAEAATRTRDLADYAAQTDPRRKQVLRNEDVFALLDSYETQFTSFERRLWGDTNALTAGSDLLVLVLSGVGATTGGTATKAALAAAAAGVTGAQGVISKDIYYQRTLPALLLQIEADRDDVKASIIQKLSLPADDYPLQQAFLDLDTLKRASGIPNAIGGITSQASQARAASQDHLLKASFNAGAPIADDVQQRLVAVTGYIRALGRDPAGKPRLDRIADLLGVPRTDQAGPQANAIRETLGTTIRTGADMDRLVAQLKTIDPGGSFAP